MKSSTEDQHDEESSPETTQGGISRARIQSLQVFPGGSEGKVSACYVGDQGSIPGLGSPLEKEMATHSSTRAWKIPWMEEPCRL